MKLQFQYRDNLIALEVEAEGDFWRVRLPDGSMQRIAVRRNEADILQIAETEANGSARRVFRVPFARTEKGVEFAFAGSTYAFTTPTARQTGGRQKAASGELIAPMVGVIADVLVTAGQTVEAYQPLVIVEAMKVMAAVEAPFAGTVRAVHVAKGQRVAHGEPVVEIAPTEKT